MAFDPESYWKAHGPHLAPPGYSSPEQALVEKELALTLENLGTIKSVCDVGCGQGRLARFLEEQLPDATYTGVDLAEAQVNGTAQVRPDGTFYVSKLQDFRPGIKWDLVLCSEVLMHIPPPDMARACQNLLAITGRWLITVDWTKPLGPNTAIAEWNWLHAYEEYLGEPFLKIPVAAQSIFIFRG